MLRTVFGSISNVIVRGLLYASYAMVRLECFSFATIFLSAHQYESLVRFTTHGCHIGNMFVSSSDNFVRGHVLIPTVDNSYACAT